MCFYSLLTGSSNKGQDAIMKGPTIIKKYNNKYIIKEIKVKKKRKKNLPTLPNSLFCVKINLADNILGYN